MKEFNLDAALNGEPVNANGQKCYVVREVTELLDDQSLRRFVVIFPNSSTNAEVWDEHDLIDDIRMWEEPKISIEDLPKPFYPKMGEWFYYVNPFGVVKDTRASNYTGPLYGCFKTEKDARKWLHFMKSMME